MKRNLKFLLQNKSASILVSQQPFLFTHCEGFAMLEAIKSSRAVIDVSTEWISNVSKVPLHHSKLISADGS